MGPGVCCKVPAAEEEEDTEEEDSEEEEDEGKEAGSKEEADDDHEAAVATAAADPNLEFAVGGFRTWATWHDPKGTAEACRQACKLAEQAAKDGAANAELLREHACRVVAR